MNHRGTTPIETKRLLLRRFTPEDAEAAFRNWMGDDEVTKFLRLKTKASVSETHALLEKWVKNYQTPDFYLWAVVWKETGEPVGSIGGSVQSETDAVAEIGFCLGRAYWNRGIMTEALSAVLRFLLLEVGFNRAEACHSVLNPASGRVMQKAGLRCEGTLRQSYRCRLGYQDCRLWAMLREDLDRGPKRMREEIRIGRARAEDYEQLAALEYEVFSLHRQNRPDFFGRDKRLSREEYRRVLTDPGYASLTAALPDGRIAGFCLLRQPEQAPASRRKGTALFIDDFCVGKEFHRRGVGTALFGAVREFAEKCGASRIELNVWQFNESAAAFYRSMGFTPQRTRMEYLL